MPSLVEGLPIRDGSDGRKDSTSYSERHECSAGPGVSLINLPLHSTFPRKTRDVISPQFFRIPPQIMATRTSTTLTLASLLGKA